MPSPSSTLATLRPELGSYQEFDLMANLGGFVDHKCLPVLEVAKQSGTFGKIPIEQLLQARSVTRAPGTGYNRSKWTFTTDSFACEEYGAEEPVDDREAEMYADYFDAEMVSAARAVSAVMVESEKRIAAALFNATTFTSQTTGITEEWDTPAAAVPITDVEAAVQSMWAITGVWANAIVFNRHVFRNLRNVTQIIDRVAAAGAGGPVKATDINEAMIAACFDLPYVFVAGGAKNSAIEGQSVSIADIWSSEYALIFRVPTTNDVREPGLGRTFHWGADGSNIGGTMESYRDEPVRSDIIRCRHDVHEKIIHTEMAWLLSNVTTI